MADYWNEDTEDVDVEDLFGGALLGGAIGDALGSFCEGWKRERILCVEGLMEGYRERVNRKGEVTLGAGEYTDDTQQTLVLVESILDCGKVDPEDMANRFLAMWREGTLHSYGAAFRETLEHLDEGVVWSEAASKSLPSNGAVMKIAPVGLWHWATGEEIRDDALAASQVTHRDPRAVAPAVAFAHVVGHLVTHRPVDVEEVLEVAEWSARAIYEPTGELIAQVRSLLAMEEDEAWAVMQQMPESQREGAIPSEAQATVVVALEAFLRTPEDFVATVKRTLTTGGDVDTFAAVAGTLSGVYLGIEGLPEHLVQTLVERAEIKSLARALYKNTGGGEAI
jgi:ADP-ribosyl-[dinitrogen reductase] hydrolase